MGAVPPAAPPAETDGIAPTEEAAVEQPAAAQVVPDEGQPEQEAPMEEEDQPDEQPAQQPDAAAAALEATAPGDPDDQPAPAAAAPQPEEPAEEPEGEHDAVPQEPDAAPEAAAEGAAPATAAAEEPAVAPDELQPAAPKPEPHAERAGAAEPPAAAGEPPAAAAEAAAAKPAAPAQGEAAAAAEPAASAQGEAAAEAAAPPTGKKKHHLLRHELTQEAQAAAAAHLGAATAEEAAENIWKLKCVAGLHSVHSGVPAAPRAPAHAGLATQPLPLRRGPPHAASPPATAAGCARRGRTRCWLPASRLLRLHPRVAHPPLARLQAAGASGDVCKGLRHAHQQLQQWCAGGWEAADEPQGVRLHAGVAGCTALACGPPPLHMHLHAARCLPSPPPAWKHALCNVNKYICNLADSRPQPCLRPVAAEWMRGKLLQGEAAPHAAPLPGCQV